MYMDVLLHLYLCIMCVQCWMRPEEGNESLGTGVIDGESLYVGVGNCIQVQFPANALHGWTTSPGPSPGILISCYALQFLRV